MAFPLHQFSKHGIKIRVDMVFHVNVQTMYTCIYAMLHLVNKVLNILDTFSFHDWMNITLLHLVPLQGLSYIKDFKTAIISINTHNINICSAEYNLFHSSDRFVLVHRRLLVLLYKIVMTKYWIRSRYDLN